MTSWATMPRGSLRYSSAGSPTMVDAFETRYGKPTLVGELGLPTSPNPNTPLLPSDPLEVNPENVGAERDFGGFDPLGFARPGNTDFSSENRDHLQAGTYLHNAMWATTVSGAGAMYWWWGTYLAADPTRNRVGPAFPSVRTSVT